MSDLISSEQVTPVAAVAPPPDLDAVRAARRTPRVRLALVLSGLGIAVFAAFAVRVLLGDYTYTVPDFFAILFGKDIPVATFVLMDSKLPRAVLTLLVGLSLGAAGALTQTLLRNPLASPDVIGISSGASVAAIIAILPLGLRGDPVIWAALVGALVVAAVVRWAAGTVSGYRLVLIGVALSAMLIAIIQYLFSRASIYDVQFALRWLAGSVSQATWSDVQRLGLTMLVVLPLLVWLGRALPIIQLGDDAARGLGVRAWRTDALLAVAVVLTAGAVAAAGPVAFVAFLSGPIARALNAGRATVVGSALVGALIMLVADYIGAYLLFGLNMPVGVITGAIGAPVLLWLLARTSTRSSS